MGKLYTVGNVSVWVYANDHLPAHVHLVSPDAEAMVEIATLKLLRGRMPKGRVMEWVEANRELIRSEWNRINPRFPSA